MNKIWNVARPMLQSLLGTWALLRMTGIHTTNLISVFFFLLLYFLVIQLDSKIAAQEESRSVKRNALILSCIFTFLYLFGSYEKILAGLENRLFQLVILFVTAAGFLILVYKVIRMAVFLLEEKNAQYLHREEKTDAGRIKYAGLWKRLGILTAPVCFLCWLPYLLMNLPGIMTVDSFNQFAQVLGIWQASNHHPWVHTMIIKLLYEIGFWITGNMSQAIVFYTVFQMVFVAGCVGYLIHTLQKMRVRKWILILVLAFYALVPYHAIFAVTVWKDAMFAGAVLLFTTALLRLTFEYGNQDEQKGPELKRPELKGLELKGLELKELEQKRLEQKETGSRKWYAVWIVFGLAGLMMSLFRSNGWYAFLVCTPVLIWMFRKKRQFLRVLLPIQCAAIAIVLIVKGPVMDAYGVVQPDLVESLAIPTQQVSRVMIQGRELTEEQQAFFDRVMDTSQIPALYNPQVSDGFKNLVRAGDPEYFESQFGEFVKIYLQLGLKYPVDYVIAFRDQTIGYWYPDQEGLIAANAGVIPNEFGVQDISVLRGNLAIKFQEIQLKLKDMIPGYGLLWSMGAITWWMLFAWFYAGIRKKKSELTYRAVLLPGLAIVATLIMATPVATDFRYAYGYVLCLPVYLLLPVLKEQRG